MNSESKTLDELLNGDELHLTIFHHMEAMLEAENEFGIYPTSIFMAGLKKDLLALIATSNQQAVEEFAAGLKEYVTQLPKARTVNASQWDAITLMDLRDAIDAHLAAYKAKGDKPNA